MGYRSRIAKRKLTISKINRKKRLQFAKDYITKRSDFWDTVLFSDETKFNIFKNDGPISVGDSHKTELNPKNMQDTVKHGDGGVMVWSCISSNGVGEPIFIKDHKF